MTRLNRGLFTSQKGDWKTPRALYQALDAEFHFDFDPCPVTPKVNGLETNWENANKEKQRNRSLARKRVVIDHIFHKLKVFRILSERYRNRRTRFAIRFNLIAALYNRELHLH